MKFIRNKEHPPLLSCILCICTFLLGLSLRNTSKALVIFRDKKRSYMFLSICLELDSKVCSYPVYKRKRVSAFIIDETVMQIGNQHFWLWSAIEPIHSSVLGIYISEERNMLVAEHFIRSLIQKYGRHTVLY
ncbi:MAG TPA: DDE-type integrase/transposase/recombinase [Nitrososphaeraceae archaeon]|nr:DDE-type integrase/transposase/recombinase [Nitrososphaeraceae archaeon]